MKRTPAEKTKAPNSVAAAGALRIEQSSLKYTDRSTASEAQRERILQALRRRPQTSYDLRRLGCYQSAARIKELRDRFGYEITTHFVTLTDRDGYTHARCALYSLIDELEGV